MKERLKAVPAVYLFLEKDGGILLTRRYNYRAAEDATGERADFFFRAASWKGEPRNCEPHKCDEVAWFPLDRLPENTVGYLVEAITAVSRGIPLLEPGWE